MDLGRAGWLSKLLEEVTSAHRPDRGVGGGGAGGGRARAHLRRMLRETGLLYGTPAGVSPEGARRGQAVEEVLCLAVLRAFASIALDLAVVAGAGPGPRKEQLLLLFAVLTGQLEEAEEIDRRILGAEGAMPKRLWGRVESALAERALSLSGDPAYGLLLHNGAVYADAQVFGRQAIDYFTRGRLHRAAAQRRIDVAARQKALLVEVLTALCCVERRPSFSSRRAILRQIEDLRLPAPLESELRARVKKTFEKARPLVSIVRAVRSTDMRRFILEQTLLSSLVDGRRSAAELSFIRELAALLGVAAKDVESIEVEVAEFYAKNRAVVDVFTVSAGAGVLGEELVESMRQAMEKNFQRLLTEIRETGELSVLLAKAARGQSLSREERARMRAQLIDVAKAIPALAIFAAPGGVLLLIALAKVLPFNLLPSAFHDEPEAQRGDADASGESRGS